MTSTPELMPPWSPARCIHCHKDMGFSPPSLVCASCDFKEHIAHPEERDLTKLPKGV